MSNQQLSESLVSERIKSEQHRLNYERLRSLYVKLQHDLSNRTTADLEEGSKGKDVDMQMDEDQPSVKTDGKKFPVKSQDPGSTKVGSAESPSHDYFKLNLPARNNLVRSPASLTCLMDDRMDDVIPGMTAVPHNEILRQCSRWKELYVNLLDEFQHYKYSTDALILSNEEAVKEKVLNNLLYKNVREATQELDKIRAEQDIRIEKLTCKVDSVIRDKMILQTEIQAIREQLAETSAKLQEKTVLCEALQRQIDEHTLGSSLEKRCDIPAHSEMQNNLHAAETRVQFLQEEISEINDKNVKLQDKILNIIQQSTKEISTLREALTGTEEFAEKERMDLQSQREEAIQHLHIQQAYIEDLDKFVNERVEENQEISKQVQNFASQVAQETEQTLKLLEERLKSTIEEKEKVEDSLLRASKVIRELTEEARRQRVTASRFITHIYQVLSIPPGDSHNEVCELRTLPYVVLSDNIINSIDEDSDMAHTYAIDTKIHMKELLKRVIFWSRQFELQKKRLRERVTQLEEFQAEQKKNFMEEIDRYRKKCSFYRDILRQLRRHIGPNVIDESLQKILPPKIYEQAGNWLNKNTSPEEQVQKLLRGSSSEELTGDDVAAEADIAQPSSNLSQAQNKFGQSVHLNPRPFISTNLHTYLRKHERFIHILDNVEKYLSKSEESVEAVNTLEDELE